MNRKQQHRPALKRIARAGIAATVVGCALTLAAGGAANAATPPSHTTAPTAGARPSPKQITEGFDVYDYSAETLVYNGYTGSVHTPPTTPRVPGSMTNYEISASFVKTYTGDMHYLVENPQGQTVGTLDIWMDDNGDSSALFRNPDGSAMTTMIAVGTDTNDGNGQHIYIEDAKGSPATQTTLNAGTADEQSAITSICNSGIGKCTFAVTSETDITTPTFIDYGYNSSDSPTQANVTKTVETGTSDQWGVAVTAGGKIYGIVNASVQVSYNHTVSTSTSWQTGATYGVIGYGTGYIWADLPNYLDTGTWTAKLGNTTFTLPGVSYTNPDPKAAIGYTTATACGDLPTPPMAPPTPNNPYVSPTSCPVPA